MPRGFQKGNREAKGRGRPKGAKGKLTLAIRETIALATEAAGDIIAAQRRIAARKNHEAAPATTGGALEYLTHQAIAEPKAFLSVLGKTIEKHVKLDAAVRATVSWRDFTGLHLEKLPPSVLKRITEEMSK